MIFAYSACGESAASFSREQRDQLDEAVTGFMEERHLPGVVVGAWVPGEGTYLAAMGYSDLEAGEVMEDDVKFEIGSVTKSFVGTVALQLVDEGKLGLDDQLGEYVFSVPDGENITIRQLLEMTSGLYNYLDDEDLEAEAANDPLKKWAPEELVQVAVAHEPHSPPGESWFYSNTNTILVGMIIELITGNDLEDEIRARIIEPLGLKNTSFPEEPVTDPSFAPGYSYSTETGEFTRTQQMDPSFYWAAGAMVSNIEDLKVWAEALGKGSLISDALQQERLLFHEVVSDDLPYFKTMDPGYGMALEKYDASDFFIGHSGKTFSHNTQMYYLPSKDAVLITLTNTPTVPGDGPEFFATFAKAVLPDAFPRYSNPQIRSHSITVASAPAAFRSLRRTHGVRLGCAPCRIGASALSVQTVFTDWSTSFSGGQPER